MSSGLLETHRVIGETTTFFCVKVRIIFDYYEIKA